MTAMKASTPKDEIRLLAKAIGDELHLAIANYQVFAPTGRDAALIDRVNTAGIHDEFNVVSEALQLTTISTLCRIWDKTGGQRGWARSRGCSATALIWRAIAKILSNG